MQMALSRSAGVASTSRPAASRVPSRAARSRVIVAAGKSRTKTIPIFPLNIVALPAATVPLMIFEARYRVLFNTLLSGAPDVEEGLVQKDSPFCGSKKFGMCYVDNEGRLASIGTELEIVDFAHVESDGRLFVTNKGRERFQIKNVIKEKPVLLCEVEMLPEDEEIDKSPEARELAKEVADLLRSTIKLNVKMNNIAASEDQLEPEELAELGPRELSFYVASFFADVKLLQQNLLEEDSTMARLRKEQEILGETVRYYSAAAALKSAFATSTTPSETASETPSEGGASEGGKEDKPAA